MTCIIKKIKGKRPTDVDHHIASVMGFTAIALPDTFKHKKSGQTFNILCGALAWPVMEYPGYVLVIGVSYKPATNRPYFYCLEESESKDNVSLLEQVFYFRDKYGYMLDDRLFRPWLGDFETYHSILLDVNTQIERDKDAKYRITMSSPALDTESDRAMVYLSRIIPLIRQQESQIIIGDCNVLRVGLKSIQDKHRFQLRNDDCPPAVMALGHIVYYMMNQKPWLVPVESMVKINKPEWEYYDYGPFGEIERPDPFLMTNTVQG